MDAAPVAQQDRPPLASTSSNGSQPEDAQKDRALHVVGGLKRDAAPPSSTADAEAAQDSKRRRPDPAAADNPGSGSGGVDVDSTLLLEPHHPHQQQQHDRSHLRKQHTLAGDEANEEHSQQGGEAPAPPQQQQQQQSDTTVPEVQGGCQPQETKAHKHKRSSKQGNKQHLLSFEGDDEEDQPDAAGPTTAAAAAEDGVPQSASAGNGMGAATAAKFKAEARQAAAARFTFQPSSTNPAAAAAAAGGSQSAQQQQLGGLVDEDDYALRQQAPAAGLSQIHFGVAQARGLRPYMEDRHCVVTALKPSNAAAAATADTHSSDAAAGALSSGIAPAAAADGGGGSSGALQSSQAHRQQHHPAAAAAGVLHDGVARCYAAIFDGHNGAGAAETAARQLHVLLAGHPALRIYKGDAGPPAVVKQEEAAVGKALKAAFRQVDDQVLAVARRDGTRDGATALVVLRLGGALYAAHAGDSRAVLCREGLAHRLTEDHKPDLPQERQRIEDAGGRVDFQRCWRVVVEPRDGRPGSGLAVSRSLGDLDFKEPQRFVECDPDVTRFVLQPHKDTFVILGSDGLWDVFSDYDAVGVAATALKAYTQEHQRSSNHQQASGAAVAAATQLYKQQGQPQQQSFALPWQQQGRSGPGGGWSQQQQQKAELPDGVVYSDGAATAAAEALLAESMRRGTMDNVTVIVMLLQWE